MADQTGRTIPAPPSLVSRERELAALRDALTAALAGCGSLILIGGEAGIGKTTLAEATLAEAASRGAMVLVGRCYDLSETPPYGPWAEALDNFRANPDAPRELRDLPRPGPLTSANQAALFAQVRDFLAGVAARRPLVMLLEDLHWADPASLELLRFVGRGLQRCPHLLLATYRADEVPRDHPLVALLPALMREARAARLDLHPLDNSAIGALVNVRYSLGATEHTRLVAYLARRSEGNALFLGELLRTLEHTTALRWVGDNWVLGDLAAVPVPALLRQVIAGRLARLGDEDRRLLAVAAVLGQELSFDLWAAVGEAEEEALLATAERAIATRVLEATGSGVRFAHALIREVIYDGVLAPRRLAWHRRAAEALAAGDSPDPDALAHHFQRAGDARAAVWLVRAGDRAGEAFAWLTAEARYEAALALLDGGASAAAERAWLLLRLVVVQRFADLQLALARLDDAQDAVLLAADPFLASCALLLSGRIRCQAWMLGPGVRELTAGVAAMEAIPATRRDQRLADMPLVLRQSFHDWRGMLVVWQAIAGRHVAARALGERVRAMPAGPPTADTCLGLGSAYAALGDQMAARQTFREAAIGYRAGRDYLMLAAALNTRLYSVGWPYDAEDRLERTRLVAELVAAVGRGGEALNVSAAAMMGSTLLLEGRWDELRRAGETPFSWTAHGQFHLLAPWVQLMVFVGEPTPAWSAIWRFLPQGAATLPEEAFFVVAVALQQAAIGLALEAGDLRVARDWLVAHDHWLAWSEAVLGQSEGALGWAAYHRAAQDPVAARAHADRALAHATVPRQPLALLAARRLLGELDTTAGRHTDAAAHLAAALALAEACGTPYERALTLLALADHHIATGERQAGVVALAEARVTLAPLEARPALARADALAAALARQAAPDPAPAYPVGLSAREVAVLRLVAAGQANHEIAAALCISPNTVLRHVSSILAKTGTANRAAAAVFALRHGLDTPDDARP